tara:strand:- start:40 stop:561 length:522 start_codon:yes stop_codon:yes gene_type:complete
MKQEIKDLLKEIHDVYDAPTALKDKIKRLVPELFRGELIVGEWYKLFDDERTTLVNFQGGTENNFGFNWDGDWTTSFGHVSFSEGRYMPSTTQAVDNALTKEAKKRGVWNVPIIDTNLSQQENDYYSCVFDYGVLWSKYGRVFEDGKWATPLKDDKKERLIELTTEFLKELNK